MKKDDVAAACAPLNLIGRSFSHPPGRCARHSAEGFSWVFRGHFGTIIAYVVQGSFVKGPSRRVLIEGGTHTPPASDKGIVAVVRDAAALLKASGELTVRGGIATTVLALSLAVLALLGVLAFHFPEYLTTPELRRQYSVDFLRHALFVVLLIAGGLSLTNLIIGRRRNLNALAFTIVVVAVALGGSRVPVGDFPHRMADGPHALRRQSFSGGPDTAHGELRDPPWICVARQQRFPESDTK